MVYYEITEKQFVEKRYSTQKRKFDHTVRHNLETTIIH